MFLNLYDRVFRPLLYKALLVIGEKEVEKCTQCKGKMVATISYLYLIPAKFDDVHKESADYYLNNAMKIEHEEQIPNGNRACRMFVFQCQNCGHKIVSVVDFLKVRECELVKGGDVYPYDTFKYFF